MDSSYTEYRLEAIKTAVQVLRSTLDRRIYVDEVISQRLADIDLEVELFAAQLKRELRRVK